MQPSQSVCICSLSWLFSFDAAKIANSCETDKKRKAELQNVTKLMLNFLYTKVELFQPYHAEFGQAKNMNFLDNNPSENRMEFTKPKLACKYVSIESGCVCRWFTTCCKIQLRKSNRILPPRPNLSNNSDWQSSSFVLRFVLNHGGLAVISNWVMTWNRT